MLGSRYAAAAILLLALLGSGAEFVDGTPAPIRGTLGALLALILPGLAWLTLVQPANFDLATRLVLSVSASLILVIFSGLLLNWTPWGLTAPTWAAVLGALTAVPALLRLWQADTSPPPPRRPARALLLVLPACIAGVVLAQALQLGLLSATERRDDGFTQLWLLGEADGTFAPPSTSCQTAVRIGLASFERAPVGIRLTLLVDSVPAQSWYWPNLDPGQRWETVVAASWPAATSVEAQLVRDDRPEAVYRMTRLDCRATALQPGVRSQ